MANAQTILKLLREAVAERKSESAERNAVARTLARYGYIKLPKVEIGRTPDGLSIKVYRYVGAVDGRDVLLITGPSIEGEVRLEGDDEEEWESAPEGAYVQLYKEDLQAKTAATMKRVMGRVEPLVQGPSKRAPVKKAPAPARKPKGVPASVPKPPKVEPLTRLMVETLARSLADEVIRDAKGHKEDALSDAQSMTAFMSQGLLEEQGVLGKGMTNREWEVYWTKQVRPHMIALVEGHDWHTNKRVPSRLVAIYSPFGNGFTYVGMWDRDYSPEEMLKANRQSLGGFKFVGGSELAGLRARYGDSLPTHPGEWSELVEVDVAEEAVDAPVIALTLTEARKLGGRVFRAPHYSASEPALIGEVQRAVGGVLYLDEPWNLVREQVEAIIAALKQTRGTVQVVFPPAPRLGEPERPDYDRWYALIDAQAPPVHRNAAGVMALLDDALKAAEEGRTIDADDLRNAASKLYDVLPETDRPAGYVFHDAYNTVGTTLAKHYVDAEQARAKKQLKEKGSFFLSDVGISYVTPSSGGAFLIADVPPTGRQKNRRKFYGDPVATQAEALRLAEGYLDEIVAGDKYSVTEHIRKNWVEETSSGKFGFSAARDKVTRQAAKLVQEEPMVSARDIADAEAEGRKYAQPTRDKHYPTEEEAKLEADNWYGLDSAPEGKPSPQLREAFMRGWNAEMDHVVSLMLETMRDYIDEIDQWDTSTLDDLTHEEQQSLRERIEGMKRFAERADDAAFYMGGTPQGKQVSDRATKVLQTANEVLNLLADSPPSSAVSAAQDAGGDFAAERVGEGYMQSAVKLAEEEARRLYPTSSVLQEEFVDAYKRTMDRLGTWVYPPNGMNESIVNAWEHVTGGNRYVDEWEITGYDGDDVYKIFNEVGDETPYMDAGVTDIDATGVWLTKVLPEKWHRWVAQNAVAWKDQINEKIREALVEDVDEEMADVWKKFEEPKALTRTFDRARQYDDEDAFRDAADEALSLDDMIAERKEKAKEAIIKTHENLDPTLITRIVDTYSLGSAEDPEMKDLAEAYDEARLHFDATDLPPWGGYEESPGLGFMAQLGPAPERKLRGEGAGLPQRAVFVEEEEEEEEVDDEPPTWTPTNEDRQLAELIAKKGEWTEVGKGDWQWRWEGMTYATYTDKRKAYGGKSLLRYEIDNDKVRQTVEDWRTARFVALASEAVPRLKADGYLFEKSPGKWVLDVRGRADDRPEPGKTYRLTGGTQSIAKGSTWAESELPEKAPPAPSPPAPPPPAEDDFTARFTAGLKSLLTEE